MRVIIYRASYAAYNLCLRLTVSWKINKMDSDVIREGIMIDVVDAKWREEKLPDEDIAVPLMELPDPEPDNSNIHETLREQEQKWADLALNRLHEQPTSNVPN